jgi:hypothetical protein
MLETVHGNLAIERRSFLSRPRPSVGRVTDSNPSPAPRTRLEIVR